MRLIESLGRLSKALLVLLLAVSPVFAQSSAGSLRGTVTDTQGGVLPGVTVILTSEATKATRTGVTDAKGGYFFAALQPGSYTLAAEISGFKKRTEKGVKVSTNDTAGRDFQLEVGAQTEEVTVTAQRDVIQTQTGAREGLITPDQIENISIIGRNPLELLRTLPGVISPEQSSFEKNSQGAGFGGADQSFSVNGTRASNLGITLDGANLRDIGNNGEMLNVPNNEFVAEVKVQMSNYAAEFGSAALNVQAITKSGSSEFHGTFYDYLRHYKLAANERARSYANQDRPDSKFQYPGFNVSGPILIPGTDFNKNRDKAFFFFGYEWNRQSIASDPIFGVVPTAAMRTGNFNDPSFQAGQHLNLPTTVNIPAGFAGAGTPAPGNNLAPYLDKTGSTLLNLYPMPNYNDPTNRYNYVVNGLTDANREQGVLRVDYNITENTKAYVRLARDKEVADQSRGLWWQPGSIPLPSNLGTNSIGKSAVANVTSVLSPTITNELLFTYSKLTNDNGWDNPAAMELSNYGITNFSNPFGASKYIPEMVMSFNGERSMWWAQDVDDIYSYNGFTRVGDNFTKVMNSHAVKIGTFVERQFKTQNFQHNANVQLNFAPWGSGSTGNDFGDLLVGRPASAAVGQPSANGNFVAWNLESYIQDSWKVNKHLTLEYGLRFGKWTNNSETNNLGAIFDPSKYNPNAGFFLDPATKQQANGLDYVKTGQVPQSLTDARPLLWEPRANFAWDISGDGSTIVRGGGGIFYNREQGNAQYSIINLPPNSYASTLDAGTFQNFNGGAGGTGLTLANIGKVDPLSQVGGQDLSTMSLTALDWPKMYQGSLSVARRIFAKQTLEVGYVGTFGRHLAAQKQINAVPIGAFLTGSINGVDLTNPVNRAALDGTLINSRRPFPTLTNVNIFEPVGVSDYNALQVTLSRQTGSFTYLMAYTYSKLTGTVGNDFAQIDPLDPARSQGTLLSDHPHNATFSWTYRVGDPVKNNGFGKAVVNGWNISGISTYISGNPIRLGFTGDIASAQMQMAWYGTKDFLGFSQDFSSGSIGAVTPTYTCDPSTGNSGDKGNKILNINCIGIPGFGKSGPNSSPYSLRGPARNFHDITVFKDFRIGQGSKRVQFRIGAFNVFNQAFPIVTNPFNDVDLTLQTVCNKTISGVPNGIGGTATVCDPNGGFSFTQNTKDNFGTVITKRGHRTVELALRLFF